MPVPLGALDFEGRADWVWARGAVAEEHDAVAEDDPVRVRLREQRDDDAPRYSGEMTELPSIPPRRRTASDSWRQLERRPRRGARCWSTSAIVRSRSRRQPVRSSRPYSTARADR
jgi:hypothetical protein